MKIIGIIPARFASTRFPGKPLVDIGGQSMISRVISQCKKAQRLDAVVVATDDERIKAHVEEWGGQVIMTSSDHPSGTDRCLEALIKTGLQFDAVVNIQGDEPFVQPSQIDALAEIISKPEADIATLVKPIHDHQTLFDPNKVKAVIGANKQALYFSRQAIPYLKGVSPEQWHSHHTFYKHLGLYAYKANILSKICSLSPSVLEQSESLEQLRWLENGYKIQVAITEIETPAIDTPSDVDKALEFLKNS